MSLFDLCILCIHENLNYSKQIATLNLPSTVVEAYMTRLPSIPFRPSTFSICRRYDIKETTALISKLMDGQTLTTNERLFICCPNFKELVLRAMYPLVYQDCFAERIIYKGSFLNYCFSCFESQIRPPPNSYVMVGRHKTTLSTELYNFITNEEKWCGCCKNVLLYSISLRNNRSFCDREINEHDCFECDYAPV